MTFRPKFIISDSLEHTADLINKPHEDYPRRVEATLMEIRHLINDRALDASLRETDILGTHTRVMWDLEKDRGTWRSCNVFKNDPAGPVPIGSNWYHIPDHIEQAELLPVSRQPGLVGSRWRHRSWQWYREFEQIHPFRDGNGRIGGIVLAWLSYERNNGSMLAPLQ